MKIQAQIRQNSGREFLRNFVKMKKRSFTNVHEIQRKSVDLDVDKADQDSAAISQRCEFFELSP